MLLLPVVVAVEKETIHQFLAVAVVVPEAY
jgi:hypothetical protein